MKANSVCSYLAIFFGLFVASSSTAETVQCTEVSSVPRTITKPGVYCLKKNLKANVPGIFAIDIKANHVVLDLNGFRLYGSEDPGSHVTGIRCSKCNDVTVKNGTVQGFDAGIFLSTTLALPPSNANIIEDIRAYRNMRLGIAAGGHGVIVRNNQVVNTGGSTRGVEAIGINVQGTGIRVMNNDVISARQPGGIGRGILILTGRSFTAPPDNLAINNRITDTDEGITYQESGGKYRDNITSSVSIPYTGGTDAGNNN